MTSPMLWRTVLGLEGDAIYDGCNKQNDEDSSKQNSVQRYCHLIPPARTRINRTIIRIHAHKGIKQHPLQYP